MWITNEPLTLGQLIESIGEPLLTPVAGEYGLEQAVSAPVIYDPLDELPDVPGGILLLVGLLVRGSGFTDVLEEAGRRGYSAVAVKFHQYAEREEQAQESALPVLKVDNDIPWLHLSSLMTTVTSGRASGGAPEGQDLFVLADALATATDGAVAIEDLDRNILAYSSSEHHSVDPLRRQGIMARRVPDMTKNIDQYRKVMLADSVIHFPYDKSDGELARCAAPVRAGREMLGSIWVIEDKHPLRTEEENALVEVANLAAIQILRTQSALDLERQVRSEWLRSALEGHGLAPVTEGRFGLVVDASPVLFGFTFISDASVTGDGPETGGSATLPLSRQLRNAAEQHCSIFQSNISSTEFGSVVYILAPALRSFEGAHRLATSAAAAVEARLGPPVQVAISSLGESAGQIPQMRREVDEIITVQNSSNSGGAVPSVATIDDVHSAVVLSRLEHSLAHDRELITSGVRALLECDMRSGSRYRESLCAYFAATGDVSAAARTLNVHPNTLRYRIKRAVKLFDLRLDEEDEQLVLWLQLRLAPTN